MLMTVVSTSENKMLNSIGADSFPSALKMAGIVCFCILLYVFFLIPLTDAYNTKMSQRKKTADV